MYFSWYTWLAIGAAAIALLKFVFSPVCRDDDDGGGIHDVEATTNGGYMGQACTSTWSYQTGCTRAMGGKGIVRIDDGGGLSLLAGLLIHSGVALDVAVMAEIEAMGKVSYIVVPNDQHRIDAAVFHARYPQAQVLCPAAARKAVEDRVHVDGICEDVLPALGVTTIKIGGVGDSELAYLYPLLDGTEALQVCDSIFNIDANNHDDCPPIYTFGGFLMRVVLGSAGFFGPSRLGKMFFIKDRVAYARYVMVMCMSMTNSTFSEISKDHKISRVLVAHGDPVVGIDNVKNKMTEAIQRALA